MTGALRWGDLPVIRDTESGIAAIEREQMTKPRPLDVEGPPRYQPPTSFASAGTSLFDTRDEFAIDGMTQHTIQLLQYCHKMASLVEEANHQIEQMKSGDTSALNLVPAPTIPKWQPPKKKHPMLKPFTFIPDSEDSLFAKGISKAPLTLLDEVTCRQLLKRSVAAICAHAGFESCNQSVLDTLTDICQEYYHQMLTVLRAAADGESYHGSTGFPDTITRVFYEMGIGNLSSIYNFYQNRVVSYHARILQKCVDMRTEYEQLRKPRTSVATDELTSARIESLSSSAVQFPSTDEQDENGDMEQVEQMDGLGLEMSTSQESSSVTLEEESSGSGRWKSETGNIKHEQTGSDDRMSSSDSALAGVQSDTFHLASQIQSDPKRTNVGGNTVSSSGNFLLKPPFKKFKK